MASLQQRAGWFHLLFRYRGRQYSHALKTKDRRQAEAYRGTADRVLLRLRNREVAPPAADADLPAFLLTGGTVVASYPPAAAALTLGELRDRYVGTHANGALEPKTLVMARVHFRHLVRHFGERWAVTRLTAAALQEYLDARCRQAGKTGRRLSPVTVQKEVATFRAAWNWAGRGGLLAGAFPSRALTYPKTDEKPAFQTWAEVERKVARGGLTATQVEGLWANLFLTRPEIDAFLAFARDRPAEPYLYPMLAFAAHTGARRSELIRLRVEDVDLDGGFAVVRECKKVRGVRTTRRVPISGFLADVLRHWLAGHPGGQVLFAWRPGGGTAAQGVHPMMAYEHFRRLVGETRWDVLKGWHVLRHSFISVCVAAGVDPRVLQAWVGHLSAATHRRYTHLIPAREQQIIQGVFV